jgi:hypothetical protein
METLTLKESQELPLTRGTLYVDTSGGPITLLMQPGRAGDCLTITKITTDLNLVSLFSPHVRINGMDITIFGLPPHAKIAHGKIKTLVLQSDGAHWHILSEK